jgi:hypothetical protein
MNEEHSLSSLLGNSQSAIKIMCESVSLSELARNSDFQKFVRNLQKLNYDNTSNIWKDDELLSLLEQLNVAINKVEKGEIEMIAEKEVLTIGTKLAIAAGGGLAAGLLLGAALTALHYKKKEKAKNEPQIENDKKIQKTISYIDNRLPEGIEITKRTTPQHLPTYEPHNLLLIICNYSAPSQK